MFDETSICPACQSTRTVFFCQCGGNNFVRCQCCGTLFQEIKPAPQKIQHFYDDQYHIERGHANEPGIERAKKRTMKEYLRMAKRLHPPGHRFLEVGCSAGAGLEEAAQSGWEATGVEISAESVNAARHRQGIRNVYMGTLEETQLEKESFDLVGFFDVFEHIPRPDNTLHRAWEVLRPGGVLMIVTPNGLSLTARMMHKRWIHFLPEHVVLYSRRGLQFVLNRNGFSIEQVGFAWKWINLEMAIRHATVHEHVQGAWLFRQLGRLVPKRFAQAVIPFNFGEFFVLARRKD